MKNKKKPLIITLIVIAILAVTAAGVWFLWLKDYLAVRGAKPVYVNSVASIVGLDTGSSPRYSGIVEPQETYKINKDETKTVSEVLVNVGDEVKPGDILFRYDTQEMQFSLEQAEIDQQSIATMISTLQRQLTEAKADQKKAPQDEQQAYAIRIDELDIQIKQQQSASSKKKVEIDKLRDSLKNTDVICEVTGVVKEVNNTGSSQGDFMPGGSSQGNAFITILSSGEYRIKGRISELNYASLSIGQAVTVHSRIDSEQIWHGTVSSIDQETSNNDNNNGIYYAGMDSGEKSSTYNFYVTLDSLEGLILGQHVYIEPDYGEGERKDGIWLPAMYIAHDEEGSFIWAKSENDTLEKRLITLGDYDSDTDSYEITSGVAKTDSIAFPNEALLPGMPTTTDASAMFADDDGSAGMLPGEDDSFGDIAGGAANDQFIPEGDAAVGDGTPADGVFLDEPTVGSAEGTGDLYPADGSSTPTEGGELE